MAINIGILEDKVVDFSLEFSNSTPYPHISIDSFLHEEIIHQVISDFPEVDDKFWTNYIHYNEKKHGLTKWKHIPSSIQQLITDFRSPRFINWLEKVTHIDHLFADPDLEGSGLHQTKRGGFLNIHADFTVHPKNTNWQRRVNVLIYFNDNWDSQWGGDLELWNTNMSSCEKKISPKSNRAIIFETGENTFHGYPKPLECPEDVSRKSLALYYYTHEKSPKKFSTTYKPRPTDGQKKWLIWGDTFLLSVYSKIKGTFGINDDFVSTILQFFNKK